MTGAVPLPGGTVTFLFTDIEGSTRLLERLGSDYGTVLQRHRDLLSNAFRAHGGMVFGSEGDALFVVFDRATSAVAAAIDGQRSLLAESWPPDCAIRVRMGLHTGEADLVGDTYVGMALHITARVSAAAHGGQILMTDATAQLAGDPPAASLGRHRLKDVGEFRLQQVRAAGLDGSFPPPRSLSALPNNLPASVDSFVGRQMELAEVAHALGQHRLVTLIGPGGSGKTRLALEAATSLLPEVPDGIWFVSLAPLTDGRGVLAAVTQSLRISDRAQETVADTLEDWLRERQTLLVLDNCEHVVEDVRAFCERFLAACSGLRILATSREILAVRGECAMPTPPLDVADDPELASLSDAVKLFLARAAAAAPAFVAGPSDLAVVAEVCRHLDGLPLAIELAAARLRALSLRQIADRLDDRFRLLGSGRANEQRRPRTLEAVVAWSYDLLTEPERVVFERLSVFPEHFTLDMAEDVAGNEADVLDTVTRLVEKSLVTTVFEGGEVHYRLLETLRQYGGARLRERGEADACEEALFGWAMARVAHIEQVMRTPAQDDALRLATANAVTYREVTRWAGERGRHGAATRIASAVPLYHHRGERRALIGHHLGRAAEAGQLDEETAGHAWAAIGNIAFEQADWAASMEASVRAAGHFEAAGLGRLAAWSQYLAVHAAWGAGDLEEVDRLVAHAVTYFRRERDDMGLGYSLWVASLRSADLDQAKAMAAEADELLRKVNVPMGIAHNVEGRGIIAYERGEHLEAARFIAEAVEMFAAYENLGCTAHALEAAAVVAGPMSPAGAALTRELLTAAEALRRQSGQGHRPWEIRARLGSLEEHIGLSGDPRGDNDGGVNATRSLDLGAVTVMATDALRGLSHPVSSGGTRRDESV
jgi:predicted ATPase/class 3 adenylate cyclase